MSIFDNVENKNIDGNFEQSGGEPIPNNTNALAYIKDVSWKEYEGDRYINIQWGVLKPEEIKNRVVFQKLRVKDSDSDKASRATQMLLAIDFNAGGKLPKDSDPTDRDLVSALSKAIMGIKIMKWEIDGKEGNWISAVSAKAKAAAKNIELPKDPDPADDVDDDDIPF